ncbi:MAG: hypothetical protein ACHRXM_22755, partial [Isosphaerales bacterium]
GGKGGDGGFGMGGGIFNSTNGTLSIDPGQGAKKGSKQAKSIDLITANQARLAPSGVGSLSNTSSAGGLGGFPNGPAGQAHVGAKGTDGSAGVGVGGGLATFGAATIDNTTIAGNTASTNDNDVDGTFSV